MKNDCLTAALAVLDEAGIRDREIAAGSKHPQIRFRINGAAALYVFSVPGTPGDHRSPANTRRDLKKMLRELGVIVVPERPEPPPQPVRQPSQLEIALREIEDLKKRMLAVGAADTINDCAAVPPQKVAPAPLRAEVRRTA
jgi:hypothetical protein